MPTPGQGIGSDKQGWPQQDFIADHDGEVTLSRSLLPAFLLALILHALLAWVELDLFKRPIPVRAVPNTLTIDIVSPRPARKPLAVKNLLIPVKEPKAKKKIETKTKPSPSVKPKSKDRKRVQPERPIPKGKPIRKDENLAHLSPVDIPAIKKQAASVEENTSFIPDMVDIPMALPKMKDISEPPSHAPITYALPMYQENIPPQYPLIARRRGYQGKVLLEVLVKKDGKPGSIRLARSSGYEILDRAAIKGVKNWLFHPAKRGDELVEMWVKIPIRFQLK